MCGSYLGLNPRHPHICVGIVWYQDKGIFRTIDSIPDTWDIIVVDGRFTGSKAPDEYSSKDLRDRVKKYKNVTLVDYSGMEFQARNQYFERSEGFDILLVIDSDEWISSFNPEIFYNYVNTLKSGKHTIEFVAKNSWVPRLFINPFKWRYYLSHRLLKYDDGAIQNVSHGDSKVNGIETSTNDDLRMPEQIKYTEDYQTQLWAYETNVGLDKLI